MEVLFWCGGTSVLGAVFLRSLLLLPSLLSSLALLSDVVAVTFLPSSILLDSDRPEQFRRCFSQYADRSCQDVSFVTSDRTGQSGGLRTTCSETWTALTRGALPAQCKPLLFQAKVVMAFPCW